MMLFEFGYRGPLQYFVPLSQAFGPTDLFNSQTGAPLSGPSVSSTNTSGGGALWVGPYSFLSPGLYNVTFQLETTDLNSNNSALIQLLAGPTASVILGQFRIGATNFTEPSSWTNITTTVYINSTYDWVQYIARSYGWQGTLLLRSIAVIQLSVSHGN